MRGAWIPFATIAVVCLSFGCAEKKQANQDSAANTQQVETQTPSQAPAAEVKQPVAVKSPAQPAKKVEKPKPAPAKPEEPARPHIVNRDVTVPSGTELAVALREKISTEEGKVGQSFTAVTKEPVHVEGLEPIPTGSVVTGEIAASERAGRVGGKAKLTLVFRKVELPDGKSYPISAAPLKLEGEGTAKGDVEKVVGGAVGGGILGGVLGGKKGAGKGAAAGTIAGGIFAVATRGNDIVLDPGKEIKVTLDAAVTIPMIISVAPGQNP